MKFIAAFLLGSGLLACQQQDAQLERDILSLELLTGDLALCGDAGFGDLNFSVDNQDSAIQKHFNLAVSLLHSFEYDEAEKVFARIISADPKCVMAYWGVAMCNVHPLWAPPTELALEKGARVLALASQLPRSEKEQEYLDAIGAFYHDWETRSHGDRTQQFAERMGALHDLYPNDIEAAAFYALSLIAAADPADKTYQNQIRAGEVLESLFRKNPNHPGLAHYLIHTYDYPVLAERALFVARKYTDIAPSSAHAQHMPSHIFITLGLWEESIASNLQSTESARCYAENVGMRGHWDEEFHGMDYLVYAYLQTGQNQKAVEQLQYLHTLDQVYPANFKVAYASAAIPARIALETRDWAQAAHLSLPQVDIPWESFQWQKSLLHFARGLGSVRMQDMDAAENELNILRTLHQQLTDKGDVYQATEVHIEMKTIEAWMASLRGNTDLALTTMKEAAELADGTEKHPVTPGALLPPRELLGDLYFVLHKPAEALTAYEQSLERHPNRLNSLYGAARAARSMGNEAAAKKYYSALLQLRKAPGDERAEFKEAGTYLDHKI